MTPSYSRSKPNAPATTLPCYAEAYKTVAGRRVRLDVFQGYPKHTKDANCGECVELIPVRKQGRGHIWKCGWHGDQLFGCGHRKWKRCPDCMAEGRPKGDQNMPSETPCTMIEVIVPWESRMLRGCEGPNFVQCQTPVEFFRLAPKPGVWVPSPNQCGSLTV